MTRAEKNIWESTAAFEPLWDDQNGHEPIVVFGGGLFPWNQAILVVPQRFPLANGNLVAQAVRDGSLGAATSIPTARRGHAQ